MTVQDVAPSAGQPHGEGAQFVQLLPSAAVRARYLAHLDHLRQKTRAHKGRLLDELAHVLDEATLTSVDAYLHLHATASNDTLPADVDPFLLLLVLPHDQWPAHLPRLAGVA